MRNAIGWAAAALVAATGCGGSGGGETTAAVDEHRGKDAACAACDLVAGGRLQGPVGSGGLLSVTATPAAGAAPGSGFGSLGVAATGGFEFRSGSTTPGRPPLVGEVDTIVSCTRVNGVLAATVSGAIVSGAGDIVPGTRFTVVAADGRGPSADSIRVSVGSFDVPASPLVEGGIEVRHLDRCEASCGEGQCPCPADPLVCEPCGGHHGAPGGDGSDGGTGAGGTAGGGTGGDSGGDGAGGDGTGGGGTGAGGGTVGDGGGGTGGTGGDTGGTGGDTGGTGGDTGGTTPGPFIPL